MRQHLSCVWIHATDMYTNRGGERERHITFQ